MHIYMRFLKFTEIQRCSEQTFKFMLSHVYENYLIHTSTSFSLPVTWYCVMILVVMMMVKLSFLCT